ncbi:uncharacterized protein [Gorilla gorilla gorilla]|uniref:uncharacterized protein n=1 Tax=Gorilla gorilla gorilla TaxID=9595 RepID=UPI00300AD974
MGKDCVTAGRDRGKGTVSRKAECHFLFLSFCGLILNPFDRINHISQSHFPANVCLRASDFVERSFSNKEELLFQLHGHQRESLSKKEAQVWRDKGLYFLKGLLDQAQTLIRADNMSSRHYCKNFFVYGSVAN